MVTAHYVENCTSRAIFSRSTINYNLLATFSRSALNFNLIIHLINDGTNLNIHADRAPNLF